jgi:diguanylate cyclase (GGDEF)-like protein
MPYYNRRDNVSGVENYEALLDRLDEEKIVTLALLNIDHFKSINDAYGFEVGDHVLHEAAKLLVMLKPPQARIFRLNSDEFVLLCQEELENGSFEEALQSLESFFSEMEISLDDEIGIRLSFSIGVARGVGVETLNNAKVAILELREHKRGTYKIFDKDSTYLHKQQNNIYWIHKIKDSISSGKMFPFFQPIVNNKTLQVEKYECLVRIEDDNILIPPIRFMEAAKLTGMLPIITRTMIQQSCEKFANSSWEFSINITSEDFYMDYLEEFLLKNINKHNIKPEQVVLEILEDITSLNESNTLEQLHSLRQKGFKIAIDDFGSESSNLSRLLEFSPDYIKIDGSFIKNILLDEKSRIIAEAIIFIAHKSNIPVIAEYVHSKDVQDAVVALGVDYSQGYYFSEPKQELHTLI